MKRIFGLLLAATAALCLVPVVHAQFTTVSASNLGGAGHLVAYGTIYWQPIVPARIGSGSGQLSAVPYSATVSAGAFTVSIADALASNPNTCYAVTWIDNVTGNAIQGAGLAEDGIHVKPGGAYGCVQPTGSAWNFDSYVPPSTAPVIYQPVPGPMGPGMNPRGAYSSGATYATGDLVSYGGSNFTCITACSGVTPVAGPFWELIASGITYNVVSPTGDAWCAPGAINACLDAAETYATTNETGSANAVTVHIPPGSSITGGPYTLISGMTLEATVPARFEAGTSNYGSSAHPNGGSWIDCGGAACFNTGGVNGVANISFLNLGFKNWSSYIAQFGTHGGPGLNYGAFRDIYAIGSSTCCVADKGLVFLNSQLLDIENVNIVNVNQGLVWIGDDSAVQPGNSVVSAFYQYTYPLSVANGNNAEPPFDFEGVNLITLIRPQVNVPAGDKTADAFLIENSETLGVYDADVECEACLNGFHLINSAANHIGIIEMYGTADTVNGINVDATSLHNTFESEAPATSVNLSTASTVGAFSPRTENFFVGDFANIFGAPLRGLVGGNSSFASLQAGSITMPNSVIYSAQNTVPVVASPGANDAVEIGSLNAAESYGGILDITINVEGLGGYLQAKAYQIPWTYNSVGVEKAVPVVATPAYSGNDFDLDLSISGNTITLWIVRTAGTTAATAYTSITQFGSLTPPSVVSNDTWTPSTAVSTMTAATALYAPANVQTSTSALADWTNVGIANGDVPVWNSTTNKWTPGTGSGGGSGASIAVAPTTITGSTGFIQPWAAPATGNYKLELAAWVSSAGTGGSFNSIIQCDSNNGSNSPSVVLTQVTGSASNILYCHLTAGQEPYIYIPFVSPTGSPAVTYEEYYTLM